MIYSQHPLDNKLLLGRYRVMRLLGEGGMGTVHLARVEGAEGFTRPVVVKRMKRDVRASEEGNRLFIREAKILSKLQHPGIVGISDFGVEDGAHIMVLEYVHGYTLSPWLDYRHNKGVPLPVDVCLYIVRRILDALHYAHHFDTEEGQEIEIVHRDISPDNVLLSNKGYVHLLDFGIASMRGPQGGGTTKSGGFRGKLCYAAPETVKGEVATPKSDQYSAAVLLLELLTGMTPFEADSVAETFQRMVNEVPEPASVTRDDIPPGLDEAIARALEKDPGARYESAFAFSKELRRFQTEDDEDIAQRLKELVREEFELLPAEVGVEPLKERESALERILSTAPGPLIKPERQRQANLPTVVDVDGRSSFVHTPGGAVAAAPAAGQKPIHGLLWGLLVIGGLIAVGLGAAVALLSRGGSGDQVVVVGGDRPTVANSIGEEAIAASGGGPKVEPVDPVSPVNTGAESSDVSSPPTLGDDAPGDPTSSKSQSGAVDAPTAKPAAAGEQQMISRAVHQKSAAFQSCFAQHMDQTKKSPQAVLHFSVAKQGGAAQVKVEPTSVAATPLGSCLKTAANSVRFPPLKADVAFRVPVRARVSRAKGQP